MNTKPFSHYVINIVSLLFVTLLSSAQDDPDDPFAPLDSPIVPRIAHPAPFSKHLSPKVKNPKALEITSLFETPIEYLPDAPTKLTDLPLITDKANPTDKIYNISSRFPNIKNGDQQWVHYNATKSILSANANAYLVSSIRDYIQRVEMTLIINIKIHGLLVEVDAKTDSSVKNIETLIAAKSNKVKVLRTIDLIKEDIDDYAEVKKEGYSYNITADLHRYNGAIYTFIESTDEAYGNFSLSAYLESNKTWITECGMGSPSKKKLLIVKLETLSRKGRTINFIKTLPSVRESPPIEIPHENDDPFSNQLTTIHVLRMNSHFIDNVDPIFFNLIQTPNTKYFDKADIVYEVSKLFTQVYKKDSKPIFFNKSKSEILSRLGEADRYEMIGILSGLTPDIPRTFHTITNFYEVNSRVQTDENWNIYTILNSAPKPLFRLAQSSGSAEMHIAQSPSYGLVKISTSRGDDGMTIEQEWEIDINTDNLKLKKKLNVITPATGTKIIDLKDLGNGRSIIMVIETKEEPFYKIEDRFGIER